MGKKQQQQQMLGDRVFEWNGIKSGMKDLRMSLIQSES